MNVYRTNAEHRLVAFGLFDGFGGHQGLYRKATTSREQYLEQAQQYYGWAASFSERLPGKYSGLASALNKLSRDFETYRAILSHMSSTYMDMMGHLSPGEIYHIEHQAHLDALPALRQQALDLLLDAYGRMRREPNGENRKVFQEACKRYQALEPGFDEAALGGQDVHGTMSAKA